MILKFPSITEPFATALINRLPRGLCVLLAGVVLLSGCRGLTPAKPATRPSSDHLVSEPATKKDLLSVNSLVIKPFDFDAPQQASAEQEALFREELESVVKEELSLEVIPSKEVFKTAPSNLNFSSTQISIQQALEAARKRKVSGVLVLRLHDYQERLGSAVGANAPAKVYFTVRLLRSEDGREVWRASYNFDDKSVSDNLFQLKDRLFQSEQGVPTNQGLGWKSAQELLRAGFRQSAEDLAKRRTDYFTGEL